MQLFCRSCCYNRSAHLSAPAAGIHHHLHRKQQKQLDFSRLHERRYEWETSATVKLKNLSKTRLICAKLRSSRDRRNRRAHTTAKRDDDDEKKQSVRYAPGNFSSFTDTGVAPPKMNEEYEAIKFDNPVEFIPYFLYAWVLLGFVFPSVVSSLPIAQEQDDGGAALLYQTQLCSEVMKLTYLSYELRKRKFSLSIDKRPQHILSGVMFGIGTSVAARVAEQILSPSLVESTSSATLATSTPMILAAVLSSTVLAPITEELFFRGVVLDCFQNTGQTNAGLLSAASANVFAAAIFSLAHFNFSIPALLNLFVCGIGFGSAFLSSERRNIAVPIIAHSVYNAGVLIETYSDGALLVQ